MKTFQEFLAENPLSDDDLLQQLFETRPEVKRCPGCRKKKPKYYRVTGRMSFICKECRHQIYPLAGTIYEKTTTPLVKWNYVSYVVEKESEAKILHIAAQIGCSYKTTLRMVHIVREKLNAWLWQEIAPMITEGYVTPNYRDNKEASINNLVSITLTDKGKRALGRV